MRIRFSVSLELSRGKSTGGKKKKKRKSSISLPPEPPEILEFAGSTTEIRPQPTYLGFTKPEEEM